MNMEYDVTRETYDRTAKRYAERHPGIWDLEYKIMRSLVPEGSLILDAGCGPGRDTKYFLSVGYNVMGVDYSAGMLEEARKRVPNGNFQKMNILELGFDREHFDAIWACASLLHIKKEDMKKALREFYRVLKQNGVIFISVKEGNDTEIKSYPDGSKRFFAYYKENEIRGILTENRFSVTNFNKLGDSDGDTWLCIFAKKI